MNQATPIYSQRLKKAEIKEIVNTDLTFPKENSLSDNNQFNNDNIMHVSPTSRDTLNNDNNQFRTFNPNKTQIYKINSPTNSNNHF